MVAGEVEKFCGLHFWHSPPIKLRGNRSALQAVLQDMGCRYAGVEETYLKPAEGGPFLPPLPNYSKVTGRD
jgi:hypothetical protein